MTFEIVHLKTIIFERPEHLKNSSKILANTFSNSLAILNCRLTPANYFQGRIPDSVHLSTTLSRTLMIPFPSLSHNSFRERTPLPLTDFTLTVEHFFLENQRVSLRGMHV